MWPCSLPQSQAALHGLWLGGVALPAEKGSDWMRHVYREANREADDCAARAILRRGSFFEVGDFDEYTVKVDGSGRLTTRNRRFLRPIRCYKEAISRPAPVAPPPVPAAGPGPAAPAVPASTPTAPAAPRRSARVAKRTYADAAASRRPSHQ